MNFKKIADTSFNGTLHFCAVIVQSDLYLEQCRTSVMKLFDEINASGLRFVLLVIE